MQNQQVLQQCLELLDASTLSEARKKHWMDKLAGGHFSEADENALTEELDEQITRVDAAIQITEIEMADAQEKLAKVADNALPYLRKLAEEQPEFLQENVSGYKKKLVSMEKGMMAQVEGVRGSKQNEEIEAIRKKLKS